MKLTKLLIALATGCAMTTSYAELSGINSTQFNHPQILVTGLAGTNRPIILISKDDGKTWKKKKDGPSIWTLTYANKQYIAASTYRGLPELATSTDGISWVLYSMPDRGYTAIRGNNQYLVTLDNCLATTQDEVKWNKICLGKRAARDAIWTGKQYILVGSAATIYTSPDGQSWTLRRDDPSDSAFLYSDIAWDHAKNFVTANYHVEKGSSFLTSSDGQNWTDHEVVTPAAIVSITWGKDKFVAVGENGTILTSTDAIKWTQQQSGITSFLEKVRWVDHQFIAVGYSDYPYTQSSPILTSPDGIHWTWHDSGTTIGLGGIA